VYMLFLLLVGPTTRAGCGSHDDDTEAGGTHHEEAVRTYLQPAAAAWLPGSNRAMHTIFQVTLRTCVAAIY